MKCILYRIFFAVLAVLGAVSCHIGFYSDGSDNLTDRTLYSYSHSLYMENLEFPFDMIVLTAFLADEYMSADEEGKKDEKFDGFDLLHITDNIVEVNGVKYDTGGLSIRNDAGAAWRLRAEYYYDEEIFDYVLVKTDEGWNLSAADSPERLDMDIVSGDDGAWLVSVRGEIAEDGCTARFTTGEAAFMFVEDSHYRWIRTGGFRVDYSNGKGVEDFCHIEWSSDVEEVTTSR